MNVVFDLPGPFISFALSAISLFSYYRSLQRELFPFFSLYIQGESFGFCFLSFSFLREIYSILFSQRAILEELATSILLFESKRPNKVHFNFTSLETPKEFFKIEEKTSYRQNYSEKKFTK